MKSSHLALLANFKGKSVIPLCSLNGKITEQATLNERLGVFSFSPLMVKMIHPVSNLNIYSVAKISRNI